MIFTSTPLSGLYEIDLEPHKDPRGSFTRTYCNDEFKEVGLIKDIVQINHSISEFKGTFRGFHFQHAPFVETKIIRCIAGTIVDIVIDIRRDSPTFLNAFHIELSADNYKMLLIPEGMAHGFQTIEDRSSLLYLHTEYYNRDFEDGIRYNDPLIDVTLPLEITTMSERDSGFKYLDSNFKGI